MIFMLISRRRLRTVCAAVSLLLAAGCSASATEPAGGPPGQLAIVTAFYPFQFVAERVAGDHATVTSLTEPGAEPHDVELGPQQVASLSSADLVVYEKSFQPAVDEAVMQSKSRQVLDTATVVPLSPLDHSAVEEGGGLDPHVWLDPTNLATIAGAVTDRLTAIDPAHATDYTNNADQLKAELASLDHDFTRGLAHCRRTEFITTHAAFGYLAHRYSLVQIGISGLSPDAEPSPARIAEIQRLARDHQLTTIFSETLVSPAVAESIAGDLGLVADVLDPLEGITGQSRGRDYVAVMRSNLTALEKAGGCA